MDEYINRESLQKAMDFVANDPSCPLHIAATIDQNIALEPKADVVERNKLKQLIANKYGDLDNICGCNVNGQWLSVAAIVELIDRAAKE